MEDSPGLSDQYRKASPWPVFVALGLPLSEIGLVFDLFPIAVGGLLLFCGSIVGLLLESEYAKTVWKPLVVMSGLLAVFGGLLILADGTTDVVLLTRAYATFAAAIVMALGVIAGKLFVPKRGIPT